MAFPGHIACDAASRSEVVVPIFAGDEVAAVLDVDSPVPDRFTAADVQLLEAAASLFGELHYS
jgi:GAF domain-containing protein